MIVTFLASNHQKLTPYDGLKPFLVVACFIGLKKRIFGKPLTFLFHGTPQTAAAARNAVRSLGVREKLSDFFRGSAPLQILLKFKNYTIFVIN